MPVCNIGPSKIPFILLLLLVGFQAFGMSAQIIQIQNSNADYHLLWAAFLWFMFAANLYTFFRCALGESGIPESLYFKSTFEKYPNIYGKQSEEKDEEERVVGEERTVPIPVCRECNLLKFNMGLKNNKHIKIEHCELCNICIMNCDHHCVFFSKCIGTGNVYYFYGSICFMFVNMVLEMVVK